MINHFILYGAKIALPASNFEDSWPEPQSNMALVIKDGLIDDIINESQIKEYDIEKINLGGGILSAGFIDTQINGGGGVLFNDVTTADGIMKIFSAHKKYGTTAILPTLISDDIDKISNAIQAVQELINNKNGAIIGIHLEGPFLNPVKKGIHNQEKFKVLNDEYIEVLTKLKQGKTLITLAPELQPKDIIKKLYNKGAIIAAGHSNATYEELNAAINDGLKGVTHLFNAMSQLSARELGVVGTVFSKKSLFAGIIADLVHVHAQNLGLAYNILGAAKLMLVTDAMPPVGSENKEFILYGKKIIAKNGSCFDENGILAGSALNMALAVKNMHLKANVPIGQALQMASQTPACFLGLEHGRGSIRKGLRADLVHLDNDINALNIWLYGKSDIC